MTVPELKALTREHRLRGYSWMRRAELIELIQNDQRNTNTPLQNWDPSIILRQPNRPLPLPPTRPPPTPPGQSCASTTQTWELQTEARQPELEAPLTKRQLKHRRNKDSKLNKKFKRLEADMDNLKSPMDSLKDKITKASKSTNARFKRRKIMSMKRDFNKISGKLKESEAKLESLEQRVPIDQIQGVPPSPLKLHPPNKTNA